MEENYIYIILIGFGIYLVINYYLIKSAASAANEAIVIKLEELVNLKVAELKKQGVVVDKPKAIEEKESYGEAINKTLST